MKKALKKGVAGLFWAMLLAVELAALADLTAAALGRPLPLLPWAVGAGLVFLLFALLPLSKERLRSDVFTLLLLALVAVLAAGGFLFYRSQMSADADVDRGKAALYGGHKVLIAAAADGDAVYLAGGVAEEYVRYGSEVWFYTMETGSLRPYGGEVVPAEAVDAVNRVWPDVILCPRGSAAKPLFDALEAVLEREPDYRPSVLQGLSGDEHPDFYADNPASTQMPLSGTTAANWERRLRLPVSSSLLTRSLLRASGGFASLLGGAAARAEALYSMNGDRVFWPRAGSTPESLDFIKLMSGDGDFVYHYYVDVLGKESFELYASGLAADQVYTVSWEGDRCSAKLNAGHVDVICPKGRTCIVTVTSADGSYWDTVVFSNPGRFARETAPAIERFLLRLWDEAIPRTNCAALFKQLLTHT